MFVVLIFRWVVGMNRHFDWHFDWHFHRHFHRHFWLSRWMNRLGNRGFVCWCVEAIASLDVQVSLIVLNFSMVNGTTLHSSCKCHRVQGNQQVRELHSFVQLQTDQIVRIETILSIAQLEKMAINTMSEETDSLIQILVIKERVPK
jgi:hypothetical protein